MGISQVYDPKTGTIVTTGGETTMDNLVVACKKCNEMKSNLEYDLWEALVPTLKDRNKKSIVTEEV